MSLTETGIKLSPATPEVAPRPRAGTTGPRSWQSELDIRISPRAVMSGLGFVKAFSGDDNDRIILRCLDATHPRHIRFAFDVSAGTGLVKEYRFWITETLAPDTVKNFNIREAIAAILGARQTWPRGEIEAAWDIGSNLQTDLVNAGHLKQSGGAKYLRTDLETFLINRWIGNRE